MSSFFDSFIEEALARRRRLAQSMGPRGQGLFDFLILGGLVVGSLGLLLRDWMPAAAPWGFALPVLYMVGHVALDQRRQRALQAGEEPAALSKRADRLAVLWSLACAAAGAATFFAAWAAEPAPPLPPFSDVPEWSPPEDAVPVDVLP